MSSAAGDELLLSHQRLVGAAPRGISWGRHDGQHSLHCRVTITPGPAIDPCKPRWAGNELTCAAIGGAQAKANLG